jgi:hemerythrin-like domain-containing protein
MQREPLCAQQESPRGNTMKSTALLLEDHKHMLRALKVLEAIAVLLERGRKPNDQDIKDIVEFLEGFGDRIHQGREENILFPALLRDPEQKNYQELYGLIFEHDRHRSLMEGLQDSALRKDKKDFPYYALRLVGILRHHIRHEEDELFPLADSTLSQADDEGVALDMKRFDKSWQDQNLTRLLRRLDNLESKYIMSAPDGVPGAVV